jgi:pimeloyl-ACP methyl ester carboxylesterase
MSSTAQRLRDIYPFSDNVLERVDLASGQHFDGGYRKFIAQNLIPEVNHYYPAHGRPVEVVDIAPRKECKGVMVIHESMATPLDENALMHLATIALAAPDYRVIGFGNPGKPFRGYGSVRPVDLPSVWSGDLRPLVGPSLQYQSEQGITTSIHTGYSFGVDLVTAAATHAEKYDQSVSKAVMINPAAVINRGIPRLARTFAGSGKYMDQYIADTGSKAYLESRKLSGSLVGYTIGLFRLTNIAVSHVLGQDGFEDRLSEAMTAQPNMQTRLSWGTEDELALDGSMQAIADRFHAKYQDNNRFQTLPIPGLKHAACDDIFLNAAWVLQATEI